MLFHQAIDRKLEHWIKDIRESSNLPIRLRLWNGDQYELGRFEQPRVTLTVREASALPLLLAPTLNNLGEAYVQGKIDLDGKLADIINVAYGLATSAATTSGNALARVVRHFAHTKEGDKESIQYHYDVSNDFYKLWLDQNMVYSCAYFENGDETIDEAQIKKIDHILTKIRLQPGQTLLDIGCGWGALVLRAAQKYGARCLGVTLSQNQYDLATERVRAAGLQDQIEIRIQDYRDVDGKLSGQFDRITSVGMFEHVGRKNLPGYFRRIHDLLADGGVAMNHGITSTDPDGGEASMGGGDFIDRYVFPQGELPHISLALSAAQDGGLEALDVESLRRHYARTLEHWAERFETNGETIRAMVGEKKYRIWRVYLAGCAHAFDADEISIFQTVLQKAGKSATSIPWSRRYIYA